MRILAPTDSLASSGMVTVGPGLWFPRLVRSMRNDLIRVVPATKEPANGGKIEVNGGKEG